MDNTATQVNLKVIILSENSYWYCIHLYKLVENENNLVKKHKVPQSVGTGMRERRKLEKISECGACVLCAELVLGGGWLHMPALPHCAL